MNDLIKFFLSISAISGILVYLAKKVVDKVLDAKIEKYKSGLNDESERFKSELTRINTEHKIRYSKLHDERAQKIKYIHDLLYELEKKLKYMTSIFQGPEWITDTNREVAVREKLEELNEALEFNRIYFSDLLCDKIDEVGEKCWLVVRKMSSIKSKERQRDRLIKNNQYQFDNDAPDPIEQWSETDDYVSTEIKTIRLELVKEFKKVIGVD